MRLNEILDTIIRVIQIGFWLELKMARNLNGPVVEEGIVSIDDAKSGELTKYDAFICYHIEDAEDRKFVQKLIDKLEREPERERKLKLFVPGRDDLPGAAQHTINAYLIEKRCRRIVILLSKAFHSSQACDFQIKFAHALEPGGRGKKLIPVIREHGVILPRILRILAPLDFTKPDIENWIWDRLYTAIVARDDQDYVDSESSSIERLIGIPFPICRRLEDEDDVYSDESCIEIGNTNSRTSSASSSAPMLISSVYLPLPRQDEDNAQSRKQASSSKFKEIIGKNKKLESKITALKYPERKWTPNSEILKCDMSYKSIRDSHSLVKLRWPRIPEFTDRRGNEDQVGVSIGRHKRAETIENLDSARKPISIPPSMRSFTPSNKIENLQAAEWNDEHLTRPTRQTCESNDVISKSSTQVFV